MSGRAFLYFRSVPADELAAALAPFADRLRYQYVESDATIELGIFTAADPTWLHGRGFGPTLEIRWQRSGTSFDLLLLTESALAVPPGWEDLAQDRALPQPDAVALEEQVLLWGTHVSRLSRPHRLAGDTDSAWVETRIPRALRYPVDTAPWVKARVAVYRYRGRPVLTRLVDLEGEYDGTPPL
jgi:hypothetical protein